MVRHARHVVVAFVACLGGFGCGSGSSSKSPESDPQVHTGSVDGYKYEMHGHSTVRIDQETDPKGSGNHPKVTCGSNWFSVQGGRLFANGKDYGTVIKPGDTIKVAVDGTVHVNGEQIAALPLVEPPPPTNLPGKDNDLAK